MPTNVMSLMNGSPIEEESRTRKRKCSEDNCIHQHAPTEILLNPEILINLQQQGFEYRGISSSSANPLLEFCLDGGLSCSKFVRKSLGPHVQMSPHEENVGKGLSRASSFLLYHCSNVSSLHPEKLEFICQTESCDINVQNHRGDSALHLLFKGCSASSFPSVLKCFNILLDFEINVNLSDSEGNTPFHALKDLLLQNLINEAMTLALLLIKSGGDINVVNKQGRTLLSFAVALPQAENFVRLLLEHGALVWPSRTAAANTSLTAKISVVDRLIRDREESAFTWFVKSTISHRDITPGHLKILYLLCHSMSDEEVDPRQLKRMVLSTLIHLGRSCRVMGPIFSQLKKIISPFWTQPLTLKYLCKRKIRKAVGGGSIPGTLYLPKSLRDYLELERTEF